MRWQAAAALAAAAFAAASPVSRAGSFSRRKADSTLRRFPAP